MKPSTFRFNYIKNKLNQIKNYNNYVLWFSDGVALYLSTHKKFNIRLVGFEFEFELMRVEFSFLQTNLLV